MRLALGHRSVRGLILLLVGLLTLWSVAGFLLSRQLASRQATTVGAALASVQAIVATAFEDVRREAWLLSQDPAVVEGTNRSDWATLARGAGPRMQALTRERFADLLLIVDATGTPLVQVPVTRPVLVPAMARPRETVARLAVVDERLYVLGIAPLPSGMVVVGRRFEALEASLARLPTRAALVVVSGDRALGSTLAGAPTQGWEAVVRAGEMSIKGESWTLRPVAEAGGGLWVLVSEREHHGESRRLWFWWAVSLCGAVAAAVGVVVVGMVGGRSSAPTDVEARKGLPREAPSRELRGPEGREAPAARRSRELEALHAIVVATGSGDDLGVTAERTLEVACALARTPAGGVLRYDRAAETLVLVGHRGLPPADVERLRVRPLDRSHVGEVIRTGRPVVADLAASHVLTPELAERVTAEGYRTQLALPIPVSGRTWGVMALISRDVLAFDADELNLFQAVAHQVGQAVARATLLAESREKSRRLETLARLAHTLTATLSLDEVFQRVVDAAVELFGSSAAQLWIVDDDERHVSLRTEAGTTGRVNPVARLPVGDGLVGSVVATREPLEVLDVLNDPRSRFVERVRAEGVVSVVIVPLEVGVRALGALALGARVRHAHTLEEIQLLGSLASHAANAINNAKAFADERARRAYLAALLEINKKIGGATPTAGLLSSIAEEAARLLEVDNAGFRLLDGDELVLAGLAGAARETMIRQRIRVDESLSGRVMMSGGTINCELAAVSDVVPEHHEAQQRLGYTTFLGVPLTVAARTIGVLTFRARRPFSARDQEIAEAFAGQAAIALEHSRLYHEATRQAQRMRALADLGRLLSETLDPDLVAQRVADNARGVLGAESSTLYRLEAESATLVAFAVSGDSGVALGRNRVMPRGVGVAGLAVEERRPFATADISTDGRFTFTDETRPRPELGGHRAVLAVPLRVGDRVVGALAVGDQPGRRFGEDEIRMAEALADQAALALENARLYTEGARRRLEAEELARLARTLTESLDPKAVGERIVESVIAFFRAQSAALRLLQTDGSLVTLALGGHIRTTLELGSTVPAGAGASGRAVAEGRAVASSDVFTDPAFVMTDELRATMRRAGDAAVLAVPLRAKGRIIGALYLGDASGRVFSPAEAALLEAIADQAALALENARLFSLEAARRAQIATLAEAERELAPELDPARLFTLIVERATRLFEANGVIYVVERDRLLVPRAWTEGGGFGDITVPFGHGVVGACADQRRGLIVNDYAESGVALQRWLDLGVRRAMACPLIFQDRLLGVIAMNRAGDHAAAFLDDDLAVLESFAARAAIALENARLYAEARERVRETETLLSLSQAMSTTLDLQALIRHFLRRVTHALGADTAGVWLLDEEGTRLQPTAGYHVPDDLRARLTGYSVALAEHAYFEEAIRTKRPVFSADVAGDPRIPKFAKDLLTPRSDLFVPIFAKERVIGGFSVIWWDQVRELSASEVALMEAVATQAGVALENVRLFEENRRQVEELSVLHELSRAVTGQLDRVALIDAIRVQVARVLDARHLFVALHDPERRELEIALRVVDGAPDARAPLRYPVGSFGLMAVVIQSGRPLRTDDYLGECARLGVEPTVAVAPLRYFLAVPMTADETVLGVLGLRSGERAFTAAQERLLTNIAHLAALALRSAQLFEERTRTYRELTAAQDQLVRTEKLRALGEMASGVAHDFNNLLASILGRAQLTLQRLEDPQLRQWLKVIERAALDGAQTVRRLQEFTRTRRDQPFVAVDLNEIVREALEITQPRWKEEPSSRGVALDVRTSFSRVPRVAGDPAELREAMTNLILNALDAMPGGGSLTLATFTEDDEVVVTVADSGVGIPEAIRGKIFDPFFTTKGPSGTGLGLSMTYGILTRHGARVAVESQEGHGTTFRLRFTPSTAPERVESGSTAEVTPPGVSLRCLVVDDEDEVGAVLGDVLEMAGHRVVVLNDGGEAIERIRTEFFDLVFTDLAMPRVSGWQVAQAVKEHAPEVPVVLVSGFGVELSAEERRTQGVDLVLGKPLRMQDVLNVVGAVARRRLGLT